MENEYCFEELEEVAEEHKPFADIEYRPFDADEIVKQLAADEVQQGQEDYLFVIRTLSKMGPEDVKDLVQLADEVREKEKRALQKAEAEATGKAPPLFSISWIVPDNNGQPDQVVAKLQQKLVDHLVATGVASVWSKSKACTHKELVSGWVDNIFYTFKSKGDKRDYYPAKKWAVYTFLISDKTEKEFGDTVQKFMKGCLSTGRNEKWWLGPDQLGAVGPEAPYRIPSRLVEEE